jgi:ribosomal protein S18 acetylase RimI-like enzyme
MRTFLSTDWLAPGEYNAAFHLIEETSRADYESSTFGWHPRRKRKEMLGPDMKYLLVRRKGTEPKMERTKDRGDVDSSILGFLSFMVDYDSSPSVPVLYIYEIHLAESLRGLGLGNHLMHVADLLAQRIGLAKVMLTCFLCNKKAYRFYADHGFLKDACSPEDRKTRNEVVAVDYAILSKDMQSIETRPF